MRVFAAAFVLGVLASLAGCGAGAASTPDWFYHWNCNGDSECLATNPTGAPSGTSDEGPNESSCTELLQFAQNFWGMPPATDSCDQDPNGGSGGGGSATVTVSGFSPSSTAPGNNITITGSGFPSSGLTVTVDGVTCTVVTTTSTQVVCTLGAMGDFTGPIVVKTSSGSVTSSASLKVVNHLYGVSASTSQFVAVGGNGTIEMSSDGTTWKTESSGTTNNLYAAAWSSSQGAFVVVGRSGTVLRSTDGINWTPEAVSGNLTDFFAVNWNGSQFVIIGDSLADFTSPDGITWTEHTSIPTSVVYGALAWSGSDYVAVGGTLGGSPAVIKSPDGATWTQVTTTAPNGKQLLAAAFGNSSFVAVGDAETVITSPTAATWTRQTESAVGDLQGLVWSGTQFVAVGFDSSVAASVIVTS
ncbi:MAG TPA: IPT/TIG domain-containing protein, partial [Gammaproteobacteria bacterium]